MTKIELDEGAGEVRVSAGAGEAHPEDARFAAYLLTDRGAPSVRALEGGGFEIALRARGGSDAGSLRRLGEALAAELARQRTQGEILRNNEPVRAHIVRRALSADSSCGGEAAPESMELSPEEEAELDRLIAEVETLIAKESEQGGKDPLGIADTWEERHGER